MNLKINNEEFQVDVTEFTVDPNKSYVVEVEVGDRDMENVHRLFMALTKVFGELYKDTKFVYIPTFNGTPHLTISEESNTSS